MRTWMICSAIFLFACSPVADGDESASEHPEHVSVFVVPHQDDWQLFMNPEASHSMDGPGKKAVFIHVTAGDAGLFDSGAPVPHYLAREEGVMRAVRFMANAKRDTGLGAEMERTLFEHGGRTIQRAAYANAVLYFLRLPDGNLEGTGYENTGWQSLKRLRTAAIDELAAVDDSARYEGWNDLVETIVKIVRNETQADTALSLHTFEQDVELNADDHSDHRNTALAMEAVALQFPCAIVYRYDGYITRHRDVNVTGDDYLINVGTWAATSSGLSDNYAFGGWVPLYNSWLGRSYSRVAEPDSSCATTPAPGNL